MSLSFTYVDAPPSKEDIEKSGKGNWGSVPPLPMTWTADRKTDFSKKAIKTIEDRWNPKDVFLAGINKPVTSTWYVGKWQWLPFTGYRLAGMTGPCSHTVQVTDYWKPRLTVKVVDSGADFAIRVLADPQSKSGPTVNEQIEEARKKGAQIDPLDLPDLSLSGFQRGEEDERDALKGVYWLESDTQKAPRLLGFLMKTDGAVDQG